MSSVDTTFLHRTRLLANKVLAQVGFELVRGEPVRRRGSELVPLQIGPYPLQIRVNNSLWREYQKNPEYTAHLGRIAAIVFETYRDGYAIDVGANIGDTAAMIKAQADVPVICVEGDAAIFPLLEKNIARMPRVTAHQCFLGEKTEDIQVTVEKDGWDATLVPLKQDSNKVGQTMSLLSLEDFVQKVKPEGVCKLLKLDIEGFDLRVLRGAAELLTRDRPVVLFEFNHQNLTKLGENGLTIFPYLLSLGYDQLHIYDAQGFFLFPCRTADTERLRDVDDYARCVEGLYYYDIFAFHSSDAELANRFLEKERAHRAALKRGTPNPA